ncbi:meiosis-specific nuclear structural protein 1-like isoform X2 [Mercenaria mercenaria]|uniref:meiosis-specific nuclear structural protein 1-like isoform X2 n=1 Tax=Mercenaria mercenaria TaxID=6596 RepID=UPI00234F4FEA|nr:meiosis-specific nuclear structural protein 1-like isoform X2 [Mercenaria mercenaria]
MATAYYGQGSTPSRSSDLKSNAYKEPYNHEAETLLVQTKLAYEAAKVVGKEQKNIERKMKKELSKELPGCINKYNNGIKEIKDAFARIGDIVNSDKEDYRFADQIRGVDRRRPVFWKKKKEHERSRVEETFTGHQSESFLCLNKDGEIKQLQDKINELQDSLENLNQIIRSKDGLEKQHHAEKQHLQRKYEEEIHVKEEALRNLNQIIRSKDELEKQHHAEKQHLQRKYEEEIHVKEEALRNLNQIIRSKDELEKQHHAEKQHLQRKYEEEIHVKEEAFRNLNEVIQSNDELYRKHDVEMQAKEEALRRLSSVASRQMRDRNPNITDLSDPNRPTKIAEKMSELFDNQWTDAFDVLEREMDDRQIIETLLDTLMRVSDECRRLSDENFFERVQQSIESPIEATEIPKNRILLSDQLKQQIKEFRKIRAAAVLKDIEKIIKPRIKLVNHPEVQDYLSRCVEIGWLCAVQDPPLFLKAQSPLEFDTNAFKDYTKRGKYVEYVVWPALYLHEGGVLLAKGVAQGTDHKPTPVRNYVEGRQPPPALPYSKMQAASPENNAAQPGRATLAPSNNTSGPAKTK